tara:strand:- start:900 stop:1364 length:465 start_codon:yes stop_codon:yes gene_type:complete
MAQVIPGSFSFASDGRSINPGLAQQADARDKRLMELYKSPNFGFAQQGFTPAPQRDIEGLSQTGYRPGSSFTSQGFTPEEGRASMGLPATQGEKNKAATEAMKQFNLGAFERAAPGTLFGQGDSGFQSPAMKASKMGFNNIYNSLFGMGDMQNY